MADIPHDHLKSFAVEHGLTQAILVGWNPDGTMHVVTWGNSLTDSAQAAQGGNFVKKALGFPDGDCRALSPRVAAVLAAADLESHPDSRVPNAPA